MSVDESIEPLAERLAARGHDALIERLRTAYAEAAATHSDIVVMDEARIEALVQKSAQHADGLQWRRALANVASEELGIGLIDALNHPAVARAQQLVGAPSYEESLAELTRRPIPPPLDSDHNGATGAKAAAAAPEPAPAEAVTQAVTPEVSETAAREAAEEPLPASENETELEGETEPEGETELEDEAVLDGPELADPVDDEDAGALRVTAIHLTGVANLPASHAVELRLSGDGLDIMQEDEQILGRLAWNDIDALEVPVVRARRRRRGGRARLIVRTHQGDASFEIPAFSDEELRERMDPIVERFIQA